MKTKFATLLLCLFLLTGVFGVVACAEPCNHTYGEWETISVSDCMNEGRRERTCSICGKVDVEITKPQDHNFIDSTCTLCGNGIEVCRHKFGRWYTSTVATCQNAGEEARDCSICSKKETRPISMLEHEYGDWVITTPAQCVTAGEQTKTCTNCGDKQTKIIEPTGHSLSDWAVTSKPTCENAGEETRKCSACEKVEKRGIEAIGHSMGEWITTTPTKCESAGEQTRKCANCTKTETKDIAKLGHDMGDWLTTTPVKCEEDGVLTKYCSKCSLTQTQTITATGHSLKGFEEYKKPTCEDTGENRNYCENCDYYEIQMVSPLGHSYDENQICTVCGNSSTTHTDYSYFTFTELSDGTYSIKAKDVNNMPAKVILPNSYNGKAVTIIDIYAFDGCSSLTKVNYLGTIDQWAQIEFGNEYSNPTYYAKNLYINNELVTEVNLTTATKISSYAFNYCKDITSATIGNSVTSIGSYAFWQCSSLTEIVFGGNVTSIGPIAFYGCSSLTNIYYNGTEEDWGKITIRSSNSYLTNATRYYYSETEPALNAEGTAYNGNYWCYVDGVPTIWTKEN